MYALLFDRAKTSCTTCRMAEAAAATTADASGGACVPHTEVAAEIPFQV